MLWYSWDRHPVRINEHKHMGELAVFDYGDGFCDCDYDCDGHVSCCDGSCHVSSGMLLELGCWVYGWVSLVGNDCTKKFHCASRYLTREMMSGVRQLGKAT